LPLNAVLCGRCRMIPRSLQVALLFLVTNAALFAALYLGWPPPEPWDLWLFVLWAVGLPFLGLVVTLACVARELKRPWGRAKVSINTPWLSVAATAISLLHACAAASVFLASAAGH